MFGRKKKKTTSKAKDTKKSEAKKTGKQPKAKAAAPKLSTFRENIRKSNEAVDKLQAAGFQIQGSPSGVVTVLKLAETRTLKSGYVVKEYKPVWIGNSYVDAANELLRPIKAKATPKKSTNQKTHAELAGEVYDLMISNCSPKAKKKLQSREDFIKNAKKYVGTKQDLEKALTRLKQNK